MSNSPPERHLRTIANASAMGNAAALRREVTRYAAWLESQGQARLAGEFRLAAAGWRRGHEKTERSSTVSSTAIRGASTSSASSGQ